MSMSAARGVVRLAQFQRDGLAEFDASTSGLLNALAPWLAFSFVAAMLLLVTRGVEPAARDLLGSVVVLLAPAVVSHRLARFWDREPQWLRYAVAFAWSQWVMPLALVVALTCSFFMIAAGVAEQVAETLVMLALVFYALALHLFIARQALAISFWRAAGMVVAVNLGTAAAVLLPSGVSAWMGDGS